MHEPTRRPDIRDPRTGGAFELAARDQERAAGFYEDASDDADTVHAGLAGELDALKRPCAVRLHTDAVYVKDGITKWINGWKKNGWKTAAKKPVKNVDLWQALETALERHEVSWHWVKGHAGHPPNEPADELAREGMAGFKR